jgi:hypothetical protein
MTTAQGGKTGGQELRRAADTPAGTRVCLPPEDALTILDEAHKWRFLKAELSAMDREDYESDFQMFVDLYRKCEKHGVFEK